MKYVYIAAIIFWGGISNAADCTDFSGNWAVTAGPDQGEVQIFQQACDRVTFDVRDSAVSVTPLVFDGPVLSSAKSGDQSSNISRISTWVEGNTKVMTDELVFSGTTGMSYMRKGTTLMELKDANTIQITYNSNTVWFLNDGERKVGEPYSQVTEWTRK